MIPSLADIQRILETRKFEEFIGCIENEHFDAKGQPYRFDSGDRAKRELAKDVTAFANTAGGYIVVGLKTKTSLQHVGEEVDEVRPFRKDLFDTDRYRKVLGEWAHPCPSGMTVEWVPTGEDPSVGIGIVFVPAQEDNSKPYLIKRAVDEEGKTTEILVGFAERRRDTTTIMSIEALHHAIRTGLNLERELLGRISRIESLLDGTIRAPREARFAETMRANSEKRIDETVRHAGLNTKPVLVLAAWPQEESELRTIFSSNSDSIRSRLGRPPSLRIDGWNLPASGVPKIVRGELLQGEGNAESTADLYLDGTLIVAGAISPNFLAWHNEGSIHSIALIEFILNFTLFYQLVLDDMRAKPERVELQSELRQMRANTKPVELGRFDGRYRYSGPESPADSWQKKRFFDTKSYDPAKVAYEIVRDIYVWFGRPEGDIPYASEQGDCKIIDGNKIRAVG